MTTDCPQNKDYSPVSKTFKKTREHDASDDRWISTRAIANAYEGGPIAVHKVYDALTALEPHERNLVAVNLGPNGEIYSSSEENIMPHVRQSFLMTLLEKGILEAKGANHRMFPQDDKGSNYYYTEKVTREKDVLHGGAADNYPKR